MPFSRQSRRARSRGPGSTQARTRRRRSHACELARLAAATLVCCASTTAVWAQSEPRALPAADVVPDVPGFDERAFDSGIGDLVPGWGLAWRDFDSDGDPDLYIANHLHYPSALYRNEGGVYFERVDPPEGDFGRDNHMGVWGDVDGDGDPDLYTTGGHHRPDHLFLNDGLGGFSDATDDYGLKRGERGRGYSAVFADLDGDRALDLLVSNHMTPDFDYRRSSTGGFVDRALESGTSTSYSCLGSGVEDIDGDGDLDVYVPVMRYSTADAVLMNRGDGTFVERTKEIGVDFQGVSRAVAFGDVDGDGDLDIYVSRMQGDILLRNRGDGTFYRSNKKSRIETPRGQSIRAAAFLDVDNDTDLDLCVLLGGSKDGVNGANLLFVNRGDGTFDLAPGAAGLEALTPGNTSTLAVADYNSDGHPDLAMVSGAGAREISGPHLLFRNRGNENRSLSVVPRGAPGDRDSYGARVWARLPGGRRLLRTGSVNRLLAQDEPLVHFGLAQHPYVNEVRVDWIGGASARMQGVPAGERVMLEESRPRTVVSHPAALLGIVPAFSARKATQVLERALGAPLPAAATGAVEARRQELLAWELARALFESVSVSEEDVALAFERFEAACPRQPRYWIEQIAIGEFSEVSEAVLPDPEVARRAEALLRRGESLEAVGDALGLRAWAKVIGQSEAGPVYSPTDITQRGYATQGWCTPQLLRNRFGPHADEVMSLGPDEVLGPFSYKSTEDVQSPDRTYPLEHVVRLKEREEPAERELADIEEDLRRMLWRDACVAMRRSVCADGWRTSEPMGSYRGVSYPIGPFAEAAIERGIEGHRSVQDALARIELEARLDAAAQLLRSCLEVPFGVLAQRAESLRAETTRPARARGVRLFFKSEALAHAVQRALQQGVPVRELIEEHQVPEMTDMASRGNGRHFEECILEPSVWERITGDVPFEEILSLQPGESSEVVTTAGGQIVFVMAERIAPEPFSDARLHRVAETRLRRERFEALIDEALGWRTRR